MSEKKGPTFIIPYYQAQRLVIQIDDLQTDDLELINLANYLRSFESGSAYVCVAEDDFTLWPGGPDIRDYQIGGSKAHVFLIHGDSVYSNDPRDLEK